MFKITSYEGLENKLRDVGFVLLDEYSYRKKKESIWISSNGLLQVVELDDGNVGLQIIKSHTLTEIEEWEFQDKQE